MPANQPGYQGVALKGLCSSRKYALSTKWDPVSPPVIIVLEKTRLG